MYGGKKPTHFDELRDGVFAHQQHLHAAHHRIGCVEGSDQVVLGGNRRWVWIDNDGGGDGGTVCLIPLERGPNITIRSHQRHQLLQDVHEGVQTDRLQDRIVSDQLLDAPSEVARQITDEHLREE